LSSVAAVQGPAGRLLATTAQVAPPAAANPTAVPPAMSSRRLLSPGRTCPPVVPGADPPSHVVLRPDPLLAGPPRHAPPAEPRPLRSVPSPRVLPRRPQRRGRSPPATARASRLPAR
jgi:hypothetical protein